MADAAAPYAAWMNTTAAQAEQTAAQAQAAVTAYESAYSMTVPSGADRGQPHSVGVAGRQQRLGSKHSGDLGHRGPVRGNVGSGRRGDVRLRRLLGGSSQLTPFSQPAQTTNEGALAGQAAAVAEATGTSAGTSGTSASTAASASAATGLSSWLDGITASGSNTSTTGLAGLLNALDGANGGLLGSFLNNATVANFSNAFTTSGLLNPTAFLDTVSCFSYLFPGMAGGGLASNVSGLAAGLGSGMGGLGSAALGSAGLPGLGAAVSAGVGEAAPLGVLSVPQGWAAAAPALSRIATELPGASALTPALGGTPMVAPAGPVGMPGVPLGGIAGMADHEMDEPMYGFRPIVMARSPAAG